MKTKNFKEYLENRLDQKAIFDLEQQARREVILLQALRNDIARLVANYMSREKIGFNELVRRLNTTPAQLAKIQRGEANLTLASIAHIFSLLNLKPHFFDDSLEQ